MQLKFKKICLLSTIIVYCASFLLQSNFALFEVWAQEKNVPRVNVVAILVDSEIYDWIAWWLRSYASYVQGKLADTKALIIPLDLKNIHAYDIHRMMENIYFDGLENVNSSLVGLVMFWNIPLPVVNQDWYIFPTVYPYVDFEDQKYVWDPVSEYFVTNNNPMWQAEIWHWLVNYWNNPSAYLDFFKKIQDYTSDPKNFISDTMWYDDFIAQKKGFVDENFKYYRNRVMFSEDLWYQRHSPLMKKMFRWEESENWVDIVRDLSKLGDEAFDWLDLAESIAGDWVSDMHTTKMVQQEIETSFVSDYNDLFSENAESTMRENVFAWWRWMTEFTDSTGEKTLIVNSDSSTSLMQLKDDILLWNDDFQWLIENLNELMEEMIDRKIEKEHIWMDIVIPTSYEKVTWKRVDFKCYSFVDRYENYYFWNNARLIDKAEDLSIYRWTYRNLLDLSWVTYDSLLKWKNPAKSSYDKVDLRLRSIWSSYDIFSSQAEWNRWYTMVKVERDLDIYDEEKTRKNAVTSRSITSKVKRKTWPKKCWKNNTTIKRILWWNDECEWLFDFARRWWWWASTINLVMDSVSKWVYELEDYLATDSWRPIFDFWWFQSLQVGEDEWSSWTGRYHWTWVWPQWDATSFEAYRKYSSPTQTQWWKKVSWWLVFGWYEVYENHTPDVHMPFEKMDYFQLPLSIIRWWKFSLDWDSSKIFNIKKSSSRRILSCWWSEEYGYKVISSVVKHNSATDDQINWIDRDRYWENGTLHKYYHDIKISYEAVKKDMVDILGSFPELISAINSWNKYIESKLNDLNSKADNLSQLNREISDLNQSLSSKDQELSDINDQISELNSQISDLQYQLDNIAYWDDEDSSDYEWEMADIQNQINDLQSRIEDARDSIESIENEKSSIQNDIESKKSEKEGTESSILAILNEVSAYIKSENSQLEDIYKLVMWLYVWNIVSTMEFIIYLEWWDPDAYYDGWDSGDIVKVWFLPEWISDINSIWNDIKKDKQKIIDNYQEVYTLIKKQQTSWSELAKKLKDEDSSISDSVDKVDWEMSAIFTITDDGKTYDGKPDENPDEEWGSITLTWWSAKASMDAFTDDFKLVDSIFSKLVEEDKVGPAIVKAAKGDSDFRIRMSKHWVDSKGFTDDDWIIQYAQWAKWPWYDSEWAIKNHDLLEWVSEHRSGMNILTPDRPIDSPRYVSMQSVAGNNMKLIYPDLFKVEVYRLSWQNLDWYDIHVLLTWWQIKKNLIKYLTWKVDEYNKIIKRECDNAKKMDDYYSKLYSIGYRLATPDKWLHACDEPFNYGEFVEALWWEKMLEIISETLYYHNLTNKKKLSSWDVEKDIELIRKSFSINDKRGRILEDYLTKWNEKVKNALFEIPTYQKSWYEVAFINSDWKDYIFPSVEEKEGSVDGEVISDNSEDFDIDRRQGVSEENDLEDDCWVPPDWKLAIIDIDWSSPWVKGFKCWVENTLKKPLSVKLTFDNSLWEILISDHLKDNVREPSSSWNKYNNWEELKSRYPDVWDSQVNPWTWFDADKMITKMQLDAETHNQQVIAWNEWQANLLSRIYRNIKIGNDNLLISDSNPTSILEIWSILDVWTVSIEFLWTGDWCLLLDWNNLCKNSLKKTFNPKTNPFTGLITSDHKVWKDALVIRINAWWWYIEKIIKYTVSPSTLAEITIEGKKPMIAWMISPIVVKWYDEYWNEIEWTLEKYDFSVTKWRFLKDWAYQSGFSTNDFGNLEIYYQAPLDAVDWSVETIQVKSSLDDKDVWTYPQYIRQANPVIKINWTTVLEWRDNLVANIWYKLTNDESIYDWWKLNVSKLQKLEVEMRDSDDKLVDLDSQILVTSQNWLVVLWQVNKQENWEDVFFETSKNHMEWGHVTLYYYPTSVAWNDIINVEIPWLTTRVINLKISSAKLSNIHVNLPYDYVELDKCSDFELFLSDKWWNPLSSSPLIWFNPQMLDFPDLRCYQCQDPEYWLKFSDVRDWYKKTKICWYEAWLYDVYIENYGGYWVNINKTLLPETWLNILYLNYFWNDRWNQWWYFSDNNKKVEELMLKSEKIITTTTMIASENKIKKLLWKIGPWLKIVNSDNLDTELIFMWGKLGMIVWWLSTMQQSLPSFTWLDDPSKIDDSKNYILFIPSEPKYSIKNWLLYNSDFEWPIADIFKWEVTFQLTKETLDNWDNVWSLIDRWINYWKLIVHLPTFVPKVSDFTEPWNRYIVEKLFSKWSTDSFDSVWLFDWFSEFKIDSSYKSIQDSDEIDEQIWFVWDFKNITLFAEWEIVWEATKKYWSELLINLWDPLLARIGPSMNVYGTDYDWWVWQEIYVDPKNDIFWTYQIDFNRDWLKDWLFVYLDWTLKLAKNYGWTPDLRNMQELMRVAVHIKEVFVWDADGNGYEDILVLTNNNQIRAYLNDKWKFDVDWNVACLNQNVFWWQKSDTPSDLEWIHQLFVEDMDTDGYVDIVTYDQKWYIKVFFWWSVKKWSNQWPNYLSTWKYYCDDGWYEREVGNMTVVTALWVQVSWEDIFDNSMMTWKWISKPDDEKFIPEPELPYYWVKFKPRQLVNLIKNRERNSDGSIADVTPEIMDKDKFDVDIMSRRFRNEWAKFMDMTLYENTLLWSSSKNYIFAPSSFLDPGNPADICSVWKNYSVKRWWKVLMNWDIVTVKVTVKASNKAPCYWAFWEVIQWPRNVYYDENKIIQWVRSGQNWRDAVLKKKDWSFSFLVDNITLAPWERMTFYYDLEYHQLPLQKMSITYDTFYWAWPDIKLQSVDWCQKDFDVYFGWSRWFTHKTIPLQEKINKEYLEEDEYTEDYAEDVISYWSDANKLPWIVGDSIDRIKLLKWKWTLSVWDDEEWKSALKNKMLQEIAEWVLPLGMDLNVNLSVFENQTDELENIIDDITKWMCNWFSFWWSSNCKWLPVPFNQAFLAPGNYHLFGCWRLDVGPLEWWIPMFHFPWTMYVGEVPVPIPWWLKWPGDWFLWPSNWAYPSFIRIYAAPTLTAQLWIAVCMWPYAVWAALKSPFADVGGNCVVFAVKPQCNNGMKNNEKKKDKDNPNPVYEEFVDEVKNSWVCLQSTKWPMVTEVWMRSSPFDFWSFTSTYHWEIRKDPLKSVRDWFDEHVDVWGWSYYQVEYNFNALNVINLETSSYIWMDDDIPNEEKNSIFIWDVDILWWDYNVNKIKWWIQQWLRKLLIDNWLDPQIRYILAQLTRMHINIKLPDLWNLISNDVQSLKDKSQELWNIWKNENEKQKLSISKWSDVSYENMQKINKSIANPFESLSTLFDESNLINISTEPITVKVPIIFAEDITAYQLYLQQWLEVNQWIVDERKSVVSSEDFIEFEWWNWQKMQGQIYANLMTLQEYRNFPYEIYEWIHAMDRYVAEIVSLISDTVWYLSYWTSTNSQRFVWYVDAIVLIFNIIKTYQVLINFSIEWSESCWTCSKDTYDQYSCKLSLLCEGLSLPIIQIPNFKLPNITIDLTNIDLGLDIVLPEFNFQPVRINLPDIPNLPEPPSISANIKLMDLPDIPLLPEPPELPELPSFIPEIELELPILPPAPELPKLPGSIEAMIEAAKVIWKIYCIVKWKFGLVWEKSVKAKIEQLTQRTYEVKWIDTIMDFTNLLIAPIHNYWLDYEITSYVDLQFDFTAFYDYLDTLTKSINNLTTSSVNWVNKETNSLVNDNPLTRTLDSVDSMGNINVDLKLWMVDSSLSSFDLTWLSSDDIEYVDYESAKSRLQEVLTYFRNETVDTVMWESVNSSINSIEKQIGKTNNIVANLDGIEKMKTDVINYLDKEKANYDDLAKLINNDYNWFLAMVDAQENDNNVKFSMNSWQLLTFNVQLFNVDSSTKETINGITDLSPLKTILDNKKTIVDWYWNAINSNSADDLWLTKEQYLVLRDNIWTMKNQITTLYSVMEPASSTNLIAKASNNSTNKTLVAATTTDWWARLWSNMKVASVIDPSVLSKWIYKKITMWADAWKLTKVVYSDAFVDKIKDRYYTSRFDSNIVLWDERWVYTKCPWQICEWLGWWFGKVYAYKVIKEIPYEEYWIEFDKDTKLKIADVNEEVKNWKVVWQTYDTLSFSWKVEDVDAYLIKLVDRIDYSYEKSDYKSASPIYVLALPEWTDLQDLYSKNTELELLSDKYKIEDIYGNKLVQVVYYDSQKDVADVVLSNIDRKWYFARIATLNLDKNTYNIDSPWSNQVVAWKQVVWDDEAPDGKPILNRYLVPEITDEGDDLEWYVWTNYKLIVNWSDNVALYYINLSKDGNILTGKYTNEAQDTVETTLPIHTKDETEIFNAVWIDQFWNQTNKEITVHYSIPEITITDVSKNPDWESVAITAELSQDIDQWNVSFQRRRGTLWKSMKRKWIDCADIPIWIWDWKIIWTPYSAWNEIAMYDKNGEVMALMNPDTAEIKIQSGYKDDYEVNVVVQNSSVLQVCNKESGDTVFSISLPTEECSNIEALGYKIEDLDEKWKMGMFNWWKVIYSKNWDNVLFISPSCHLYSEMWLEWAYSYDLWQESVLLTLYQSSDFSKSNPIKIWMKVKPFIEK